MKYLFLLPLILLGCQSGNTDQPVVEEDPFIAGITNGLQPNLMIEGREYPTYSIPQRMEQFRVPGVSIAFFENNEIIWTRTFGYIDGKGSNPVDENTRFQAASISKPVAASGMMKLVEEGTLDLDADINDYLEDLRIETFTPAYEVSPAEEKVTLRRLVTHTAGLTVHGFGGYAEGDDVPTTLQVLRGEDPANSPAVVLDTIPGSIWRYSGGGYTLMQYVIEENINPSFPDYMQETVLTPAGMENSTYEQPLPAEMAENTAVGHRQDGSAVAGNWHTYPEKAAAGLWTTPSDLARWAMTIQRAYNGSESEFIKPETAQQILSKHLGDWGLGPGLRGEGDSLVFQHGGSNEGYKCNLVAFAGGKRQGVAIMTNGDLGSPLIAEIIVSIDKAYGWNMFSPTVKTSIDMSAEELEEYSGVYGQGDSDFELIIYVEDGELKSRIDDDVFILYPEKTDVFFDSRDVQTINFLRNDENNITAFEVNGRVFDKKD